MADLHYYVDTDVVGGAGDGSSWANAFSSLQDCDDAVAQNLTDGDGDTCTIHCRASAGTGPDAGDHENGRQDQKAGRDDPRQTQFIIGRNQWT
jgi:hypothetical protein